MTLREFLSHHEYSLTEFAALVGVPVSTAHGYVSGRRTPSLEMAGRIDRATDGAVTFRDLLRQDEPAQ